MMGLCTRGDGGVEKAWLGAWLGTMTSSASRDKKLSHDSGIEGPTDNTGHTD